jgi:hypothetical protein
VDTTQSKRPFPPGVLLSLLAIAMIVTSSLLPHFLPVESRAIVRQVLHHFLFADLLLAIWSLCFRSQIEQWRFSLFSLFVLTTMQAVGIWFVQFITARLR